MFSYTELAEKLISLAGIDWHGRENQRSACRYGLETLIALVVNFTIVLTVGFLLGIMKEVLVYLFAWGGLRLFAGGKHAENHRSCITTYTITMLVVIYGCRYLSINYDLTWMEISFMLIGLVMNAVYAGNHKKDKREAVRFKLTATAILVTELIFLCILSGSRLAAAGSELQTILSVFAGAVLAESVFLLPLPFLKKREGIA